MTKTPSGDRFTGFVGVALLTLTLAACGGAEPQPGNTVSPTAPPSTSPSTAGPSTTPGQEAELRTRLIDGLRDTSLSQVRLLERRETTVTPVAAPWLDGWQVVDVLARIVPHPVRFFVAISTDGNVLQLTGQPAEFSGLTQRALLEVTSAKVAVEVAKVYLDSTQDFRKASYRIDSVDDIRWLKTMSTPQAQKQTELERDLPKAVEPAKAKASDEGWVVTAWMMYDRRLDKHTVTIGPEGVLSDKVDNAYVDLPVPESS